MNMLSLPLIWYIYKAPSTMTYDEDSSFDTAYAKLANMVVLKFV
jgi:hypothetical protein